jgi:hypothetical protein
MLSLIRFMAVHIVESAWSHVSFPWLSLSFQREDEELLEELIRAAQECSKQQASARQRRNVHASMMVRARMGEYVDFVWPETAHTG